MDTRSRCRRPASFIPAGATATRTIPASGSSSSTPLSTRSSKLSNARSRLSGSCGERPGSAYTWHTDSHKGQGIVRFQIPLLTDGSDFLLTTDYREVDEVQGTPVVPVDEESFERFSHANAGHFARHQLEAGRLHYFNTSRVHTLVNPGPSERITLSFDLAVNDWLLARFPEIRTEVGDGPAEPVPLPGPLRSTLSAAVTHLYPVRNLARRRLRTHS